MKIRIQSVLSVAENLLNKKRRAIEDLHWNLKAIRRLHRLRWWDFHPVGDLRVFAFVFHQEPVSD